MKKRRKTRERKKCALWLFSKENFVQLFAACKNANEKEYGYEKWWRIAHNRKARRWRRMHNSIYLIIHKVWLKQRKSYALEINGRMRTQNLCRNQANNDQLNKRNRIKANSQSRREEQKKERERWDDSVLHGVAVVHIEIIQPLHIELHISHFDKRNKIAQTLLCDEEVIAHLNGCINKMSTSQCFVSFKSLFNRLMENQMLCAFNSWCKHFDEISCAYPSIHPSFTIKSTYRFIRESTQQQLQKPLKSYRDMIVLNHLVDLKFIILS